MENDSREHQIFNIASGLFNREREIGDQEIDRNFIFRFEYGWRLRVDKVRNLINQLAGIEASSELLPSDMSPKMWAYLEGTKNLIDFPENITLDESFNIEYPFRPFNEDVSNAYEKSISAAISGNRQQLEQLLPLIQKEKEFVRSLQNSVLLIAQQYQIVPLGFDLWNRFAFKDIELSLVNLRNYFLFNHPIPKFIWPNIRYIESKVDKSILRWLRPDVALSDSSNSLHRSQIRQSTRIRTWSIYFLTKRGGGHYSEDEAIDLWNMTFDDSLVSRNFRSERLKLLAGSSVARKPDK